MTKSLFGILDKTVAALICTLVLCSVGSSFAQTITSPSGGATAVSAADEFATRELQDPWDMSDRTDVGWWTFANDQPVSNLSSMQFSGGVFSATPTSSDPNFWLLDPPVTGRVKFGKDGQTHPIDASKYTRLMFRMSLANAASADGQILWNVLNSSIGSSSGFTVYQGWHVYTVDLAGQTNWSGLVDSLRVDPTQNSGSGQFQIDWASLVDANRGNVTISWTGGSGNQDIYISSTAGCSSNYSTIARSQAANGSLSFYAAGLPAGDWYVGIAATGGSVPTSCSSGFFRVSGVPTMSFTSPSEEGSSDDFATIQLGNAWDMNSTGDIDFHRWISGLGTTSIQAQTEAGVSLGAINVVSGTSVAGDGTTGTASCPDGTFNVGDPHVYPLWSTVRGATYRIDTSRYRILTWEQAIPRARDLCHGSIARIVWKVAGEATENVTSDILLRHLDPVGNPSLAGGLGQVMQKITLDLADRTAVPIDPGSPSQSGWVNGSSSNPGLDNFRIDFHEFGDPTAFFLRRAKLAALEKANDSYTIRMTYTNPAGTSATVSFFRDSNRSGFDGDAIPGCQNMTPTASTECVWNTSALTNGQAYYVYSEIAVSGTVVNRAYAKWPILIDDAFGGDAALQTDKSLLRFTVSGANRTAAQEVTITQTGGSGAVSWTASVVGANPSWFVVTPSSGSGVGKVTVSIDPGQTPTTTEHTLLISSSSILNSPRRVRLLTTRLSSGSLAAPFGTVDTPTDGATGVTGSIGVTGWAIDDVGVQHVQVFRNCLSIDNPASCQVVNGANVVFIGTAAFLAGARPDVEAIYDTYPQAYRAGWGYLVLTNMLPHIPNGNPAGGGQGAVTIYAFATDVEGRRVLLGQKTITLNNDNATRPFGVIDTPSQGGTASGIFVNFGWALTPGTAMIPRNGSTMNVVLDGASIGQVVYDQCRLGSTPTPPVGTCQDDIATLFPNYTNIQQGRGAIGSFDIDTRTLSNGLHTIAWGVIDDQNRNDGIGSRFFYVLNGTSLIADDPAAQEQIAALLDAPAVALRDASEIVGMRASADDVFGRTGFDFDAPWEVLRSDATDVRRIQLPEFGRLELWLGQAVTAGYLNANGTLRALPPGSRLDESAGTFTWAPGPGYIGSYDLVFLQGDSQIPVQVTIREKKPETAGLMRGHIDGPANGASVSRSFHIGGWALDLAAWQGSGVGAVHVWAQRRDAPSAAATFLGTAEVNVARPDVATHFGAQFDRAGWQLAASDLEPGTYDVTAYFWSMRTRQFEDARTVTITVR